MEDRAKTPPPLRHYPILILGGGFGGVYCGKQLGKRLRRLPEISAAIVSDDNYLVFQPMLPEVVSSSVAPREVVSPIRQMCPHIDVFRAEVCSVDPEAKRVELSVGDRTSNVVLSFDRLVLALGAEVNLSRMPGMAEHAFLMRNVGDAIRLRAHIISRLEEAVFVSDAAARRPLLHFVVVGGGYSGVETAGEIDALFSSIRRFYPLIPRDACQVTLVHSGERLLPSLASRLGEYCERKLSERGLRVVLGQRVKSVTAETVVLSGGEVLEAANVVATIGNSPHPVVTQLTDTLELETHRGRVRVDDTGGVPGHEWLFAVGDCSAMPLPDREDQVCPATAQFAQRQGELVGSNAVAAARGRPLGRFRFGGLGELAAIGKHQAVADVFGFNFSGLFAWWLWRTIYLMKLPGFQRKLRVMIDWTLDIFFSRDINLLGISEPAVLSTSHLNEGDLLFRVGEPAFSLYMVQSGAIELREGERVIKTLRPHEYFGERELLEGERWKFSAVAIEPSQVASLGHRHFRALVEGSGALRKLFEKSARGFASRAEFERQLKKIPPPVRALPVGDVMNRNMVCLRAENSVDEALEVLREHRHGSYPLIGADGKPHGVVNRNEFFQAAGMMENPAQNRIAEIPVVYLPVVEETQSVEAAIELFVRSGMNKVLVVDTEERLVGLVTPLDVLAKFNPQRVLG